MIAIELLTVAIILLLALLAINFSDRFGIPSLLLFLILGIAFNFLGFGFNDLELANNFSSLALLIIMFYGGFGTNLTMAKPVAKESVVLASIGVLATGLLTGAFCYFVLSIPILESFLLGSIVASTDYTSVSTILQSNNLNLKHNTASLLELESGSNDPSAYTMTMVMLSLILGTDLSVPTLIASQIIFGVGFGVLFAFIFTKLVQITNLNKDGLSTIFMTAFALLTYSITGLVNGNGYLAVFIFGILIGNTEFPGKKDIVFFFDGFNQLMEVGLFFLLGLLSNPPDILANLPLAAIIMAFMTILARPVTVFGLMAPFKLKKDQLIVISWAGLRGAAAIAFAIAAVSAGATYTIDVYHIVMGICILSVLIQGGLMPAVIKRFKMLDPNDRVFKTFNHYQMKSNLGFLKTEIHENSSLVGTQVRDLNLTFDFLVAKIKRGRRTIVPRGEVALEVGDVIVLGGETYYDHEGFELTELKLDDTHPWVNSKLKDLNLKPNLLILMVIDGDGNLIVPEGNTLLKDGDSVVFIEEDEEIFLSYEEEKKMQELVSDIEESKFEDPDIKAENVEFGVDIIEDEEIEN